MAVVPGDLVNATLKLGENEFSLETCKFYDANFDEWIKECSSDVIFCRDVDRSLMKKFTNYHLYVGLKLTEYTAVLVKKNKFCQVVQLPIIDDIAATMEGRFCTVKLDGMVVIAWDCPFKTSGKETPKEKRFEWFRQLRRYALKLMEEYNLPVVIGGEFQLTADEVETEKMKPLNNWDDCIKNEQNGTHFFYVMFPKVVFA